MRYVSAVPDDRRPTFNQTSEPESWRRRYPLFPQLLFDLNGTNTASVDNQISALRAAARDMTPLGFLPHVPILAASDRPAAKRPLRVQGAPLDNVTVSQSLFMLSAPAEKRL